ncbi:uncharacterized protein LOC117315371 [Pecten maximus]|uniref:uncharacterized protein LOC117315371 n=1 Tax=Pecten maximus TaxID=6579 RepID=UPI0014591411|nr:uncharacterized protein LOC117315371 [Pecten maximus]
MPHHCCVPHCTNNSKTKDGYSFHTFPKDPSVAKKWVIAIRRDQGADFDINKETRVCSVHFNADSYHPTTAIHVRKRLRGTAVPSVFQWTVQKPVRRKLSLLMKSPNCGNVESNNTSFPEKHVLESCNNDCDEPLLVDQPFSSEDSLTNVDWAESPDKSKLKETNSILLHIRNKEKFSILRFCNSDSDIRYYTGFSSYLALHCFFTFLQPACSFLYYVGTDNTSEGTPYIFLNKRGKSRSLSPMEELFVTLVRLRKGLPEKHLGDLYNLSEGHVSKILNTWIAFLDNRLSSLPIWPQRDHVNNTMPAIFKTYFSSTRTIIDCTEIFIEHPSASECQRETFSSYKHHNTAKGLIAIAPSGQITFISPLYSGRCSDKKIIRHCGLLDLIEEGDGVMVDRGFDITTDLENRGAHLIMPAFLSGKDQFTPDQLSQSREIATVRVHVERAVRKIKEFEILRHTVPITLCPMLEKIWNICGHLANFSGSGTLFRQPKDVSTCKE